jgi:hypothetical protein
MEESGFDAQLQDMFLFSAQSRPNVRPSKIPTQFVAGTLSSTLKRPVRETGHSPSCGAEAKKAWRYTSIPSYVFLVILN